MRVSLFGSSPDFKLMIESQVSKRRGLCSQPSPAGGQISLFRRRNQAMSGARARGIGVNLCLFPPSGLPPGSAGPSSGCVGVRHSFPGPRAGLWQPKNTNHDTPNQRSDPLRLTATDDSSIALLSHTTHNHRGQRSFWAAFVRSCFSSERKKKQAAGPSSLGATLSLRTRVRALRRALLFSFFLFFPFVFEMLLVCLARVLLI